MFLLATVSFAAYAGIVSCSKEASQQKVLFILSAGVIVRAILLFSFPNLSDDIYRFLWDGRLIHTGIHPLAEKPSILIEQVNDHYLAQLYPLLNSQEYFTIYPPVSQVVYYIATIGDNLSIETSSIVIKLIFFIAELASLFFIYQILKKLNLPIALSVLYFLNPLIIIELMGNIHFEALMVSFMLMGFYYLLDQKIVLSAIGFSLSIGAKLLPLIFIPIVMVYIYKKYDKATTIKFFSVGAICMSIMFVPFFLTLDIPHFLASVGLYFRKFEYNASIYYFLRELGLFITGYNLINILGPLLALTTVRIIYKLSHKQTTSELQLLNSCFLIFITYLFLSTTVHPWYLTIPLALGVFSFKNYWIYLWSFLILLSYSTYLSADFIQDLRLIFIEYALVFGAFYYLNKEMLLKRFKA